MQVRKQQLELDMEQQTGSKYEKENVKAVYCQGERQAGWQYTPCLFNLYEEYVMRNAGLEEA